MEKESRQAHWDNVFATKTLEERSWYEPVPDTALELLGQLSLSKNSGIIDIGGGDSLLADHLLDLGYQDVNVLDISSKAILRAQKRLGAKAQRVKWITSDILDFEPDQTYDFWYDRAAFHFLTNDAEVLRYVQIVSEAISKGGYLVLGTFSEQGPKKCSGLEIRQYTAQRLTEVFASHFQKIDCFSMDHYTPAQVVQNFIFCVFRKK